MPYCAPSENGTQCQTCSCEPSLRGSRLPAQPGISSLVRRGASLGSFSRYLTLCIKTPPLRAGTRTARSRVRFLQPGLIALERIKLTVRGPLLYGLELE